MGVVELVKLWEACMTALLPGGVRVLSVGEKRSWFRWLRENLPVATFAYIAWEKVERQCVSSPGSQRQPRPGEHPGQHA